MNLTERLLDSDYNAKRRMLECARLLSEGQLDAPLAFRHNLMPFVEPERTLREALDRMSSDGWILTLLDAIQWNSFDSRYRAVTGKSVEEMITRLEGFYADYRAFVRKVESENLWETTWVDRTCEEEETFTYGGVIEAMLSWGIPQRMVVQRLLEQMGIRPDELIVA